MTGVEAVSNATPAFQEPRVKNAQRTLTSIVVILAGLLIGIAYLAHAYGITAMDQSKSGYQSLLSLLIGAVFGRGVMYYVTIVSVLAVLTFSANTSFAGFPRLCRMIGEDGFLPHSFANVGRRLVYSNGIVALTLLSALLLVVFGGITDRLIPLFAVGAFAAFTLSQAGMVVHWRKQSGRGRHVFLLVNATGAIATGLALVVIVIAKFTEGAWISVILIPAMLTVFYSVRHHYDFVARQTENNRPITEEPKRKRPIVVVPIGSWNAVAEKALRFGMSVSDEVIAVHVAINDEVAKRTHEQWNEFVDAPLRAQGGPVPRLVIIPSPYRRLMLPIVHYVNKVRCEKDQSVAVIIPDLVEARWWETLLHNHRGDVLRALLLLRGEEQVVTIDVPWFLERRRQRKR